MNRRTTLIISFALLVLGLDQATKLWARSSLRAHPPIVLVDNYLAFEYHENPGMAFGLGRDLPAGRFILIGVGIAVLFFVWRIVRHVEHRRRAADIAFGLVVGGAIGNIVDRIHLGRVVDFIVMHWQHKYTWPAYNVADAALCVGVGLLIIAIGGKQQADRPARSRGKRT